MPWCSLLRLRHLGAAARRAAAVERPALLALDPVFVLDTYSSSLRELSTSISSCRCNPRLSSAPCLWRAARVQQFWQ